MGWMGLGEGCGDRAGIIEGEMRSEYVVVQY